jgi:diaminopimelate epimerase
LNFKFDSLFQLIVVNQFTNQFLVTPAPELLVLQTLFQFMKLEFFKYHGAGNDFILIDNRRLGFVAEKKTIEQLCDRHFGIGADGLILLEYHPESDFRMRYFNSDGAEATMCGNGGRCIVSFARLLGLIDKKTSFFATDGSHDAVVISSDGNTEVVKLKMNDVSKIEKLEDGFFVDTGSPHHVRFVKDVAKLDVIAEGRLIRYQKGRSADGVNVNFVELRNGQLYSRTYERGVEDETLACGTGAVAMALVAHQNGIAKSSPVEINAVGGLLKVHFEINENQYRNIWLEGAATRVFNGFIHL